ncbi:MAG: hypothetical protein Q9185_006019 [Variospora sp. 1 TL-2023]
MELHKTESDLRALDQKVTLLLTKSQQQTARTESLEKKIHALEARNAELETRLKASDHNALSRHLNSLLPTTHHSPSSSCSSHHTQPPPPPLHALHSPSTNTAPKSFPRKETDIRTMPAADVTALLKELEVDVKGVVSAGERKAKLREYVGVGAEGNGGAVVEAAAAEGGRNKAKGGAEEEGKKIVDGVGKKEKGMQLPGKATGPPPGKVLPIGPRD